MALVLNWFHCEIRPPILEFSVLDFASIADAKSHRESAADAHAAYLWVPSSSAPKGTPVRLTAVDGSQLEGGHQQRIDLLRYGRLAKAVIRAGLLASFTARGFRVVESFGGALSILESGTLIGQFLRIRTGVHVKVDRPFRDGDLGLICQWKVNAEVEGSLETPELAAIAERLPCLLSLPNEEHRLPPEIASRDGRLLGSVETVDKDTCVVKLRRGGRHTIPRRYLRLDAGPAVISRIDQELSDSASSRPGWQQIQRASFALGKDNRRNPSVLKDRLAAVRRFLGGEDPTVLVIPLSMNSGANVTADLRPATVTQDAR